MIDSILWCCSFIPLHQAHNSFQFFYSLWNRLVKATIIITTYMSEEAVETVVSHEVISIKSSPSVKYLNHPAIPPWNKSILLLPEKKPDFILILKQFACRFPKTQLFLCFKSAWVSIFMPLFMSSQQNFSQLIASGYIPGTLSGVIITILMVPDGSDIIKVHLEARTFGKHCLYSFARKKLIYHLFLQ